MKTISTFVSYQPKLTVYLDQFLADPDGETEAQRYKRWEILKTFEVNYKHHSQVCSSFPQFLGSGSTGADGSYTLMLLHIMLDRRMLRYWRL
jgi:uncharacterized metal-binding protein